MTANELNGWILVTTTLISMGMTIAGQIEDIFRAAGLTTEQQDAILAAMADDNVRRRAISAAIAGVS